MTISKLEKNTRRKHNGSVISGHEKFLCTKNVANALERLRDFDGAISVKTLLPSMKNTFMQKFINAKLMSEKSQTELAHLSQ